jgi:hypothetical protein
MKEMSIRPVCKIKPLEGKFKHFKYDVGQMLNTEVINWNGDKFAFKVDEAALVERVAIKTWANGNFQNYYEISRAFFVN